MTMKQPEGTDSIRNENFTAPACYVCKCTVDVASKDYYNEGHGDDWPVAHTECVEREMGREYTGDAQTYHFLMDIELREIAEQDMLDSSIRGLV